MSACGVGKILADWVTTGGPPYDISGLDVRRFGPHHVNRRFLGDRIEETLGVSYGIPWPKKELQSARRVKMSPLHLALEASGASWGEAMGWERPNWFAQSPEGTVQVELKSTNSLHVMYGVCAFVCVSVGRISAGLQLWEATLV